MATIQIEYINFTVSSARTKLTDKDVRAAGGELLTSANRFCAGSCFMKASCQSNLEVIVNPQVGKNALIRSGKVAVSGFKTSENNCPLLKFFLTSQQFNK